MVHLKALDQSMESFNTGDWQSYKSSFTEDCYYCEYAKGRIIKSADDLLANSKNWKSAFPNACGEVRRLSVSFPSVSSHSRIHLTSRT